jgi:hypothetical protein
MSSVTIPFTWNDGCNSGDTVGVMALATNAAQEPVASRYFEVPYAAAGFATVLTWLAPTTVAVTLTAPSDLSTVTPSVSAVNHDFAFGGPTPPTINAGGVAATPSYFATTPTDPLELSASMSDVTNKGAMIFFKSLQPGTSSVAVDLSVNARPPFNSDVVVPVEPAPVTWTATAGAAQHLGLLVVTILNPDSSSPIPSTVRYFFAPSASSFTRPAIPDVPAFASFRAQAGKQMAGQLFTVRFPDAAVSYASAREMIDGAMFFGSAFSRPDRQLLSLPNATAAFATGSP